MPEPLLPVEYRAELLQQIIPLLRSGESCSIVGIGSSGKSNIARHILRADVRLHYWGGDAAARTVVVNLNCKPIAHRPIHVLYINGLDQLEPATTQLGPGFATLQPTLKALWQEAQTNPEILAKRNLDLAIKEIVRAGAELVVFILDDCDDLFTKCSPVLFADLRELRDLWRPRLVYLTLSRRQPVYLRQDTPEYEEFFELVSATGHTLPVPPHSQADSYATLRRLAERQEPSVILADPELARLYEYSGGHAGLMRALFFASRTAVPLNSPDACLRLARTSDVRAECQKIWASLEEQESSELTRVVAGQMPSPEGLYRLERLGLLAGHPGRVPEFTAPVMEYFVYALQRGNRADPIRLEFLPPLTVRVDGKMDIALTPPEYAVLRTLALRRPQVCPFNDLIQAMLPAELTDPSARAAGHPLQRLERYVLELKAKIRPARYYLNLAPQGYQFAA